MECMLRMIWLGDSSNEKKSTRSPRRHAAWAKLDEIMVLPVPGVPVSRMLLPRKNPRPRKQNAAAAKKPPSAQHRVEPRDAGGNPLARHLVIQPRRRDGQHADALVANEKWKFVGVVQRTAIFHHAQIPRSNLIKDPMVEQDDAVGHVFLQPVARQLFAPALGRDDGGHAFVLEPSEEPAQ